MNVNEAIEYIHSLSKFGKKSGLDNIKLLLQACRKYIEKTKNRL